MTSEWSEPTPEPGGRRRRYYEIVPPLVLPLSKKTGAHFSSLWLRVATPVAQLFGGVLKKGMMLTGAPRLWAAPRDESYSTSRNG